MQDEYPPTGCLGIDGCPGGWIALAREGAFVAPNLGELLERLDPGVIALDMPVGLADDGPRACDREARRLLGAPRASSVFTPPTRAALNAASHAEAGDLNAAACGKRMTIQTYHLLPKIREVDSLLRASARWRERVFEAHPELSFAAMNHGAAIAEPKRRSTGHARRRVLIADRFGADAFMRARRTIARREAADDDIADAFACLFTAERIAGRAHGSLPATVSHDRYGLPMRIVY